MFKFIITKSFYSVLNVTNPQYLPIILLELVSEPATHTSSVTVTPPIDAWKLKNAPLESKPLTTSSLPRALK